MQRFRIMGIYLTGVVAIIAAAIWGVSSRAAPAPKATTSALMPPAAANQPQRPGSGELAKSPGTAPAEISGLVQVSIDNFQFVPEELTIAAGTTVTWVNNDDIPHTATSTVKPYVFNSKLLDKGSKYSFQFNSPGSYPYYCKVHPHMTGRIIVK